MELAQSRDDPLLWARGRIQASQEYSNPGGVTVDGLSSGPLYIRYLANVLLEKFGSFIVPMMTFERAELARDHALRECIKAPDTLNHCSHKGWRRPKALGLVRVGD